MAIDLLIRGGSVVDGTGAEPRRADLAIDGREITAVEEIPDTALAGEVLDATGCHVTPGFIDVHTHSDYTVLACPTCDSKLHQGVTTEILGNCGFSPFPLRGHMLECERREIEGLGLTPDWDDLPSYRARLAQRGHAFNVAVLVGNGNLRGVTCGLGNVRADKDVLRAQIRELEDALDAGALGLSSGLIYAPSKWADLEELVALADVLRRHGACYTSHIRGEGDTLLDAVDEALAIGERAGVRVQVSHLKASAPRNWGKVERALDKITASDEADRWVRFDKYPYTASSTSFASMLPDWVLDGTKEDLVARLREQARQEEIIDHAEARMEADGKWKGIIIADPACEEFRELAGLAMNEAADGAGLTPGRLWIELLIASHGDAAMSCFTQSQWETDLVLNHPWGMVGSDASVRAPTGVTSRGNPHPRAYGTFPRYLRRHVRELETLTIGEAVRKMTQLPAQMFGLRDRGALVRGAAADVAIFDLEGVNDPADYAAPQQLAQGFRHVIVNGRPVIRGGEHTGATPGQFLERS
jgi:N-acyl-D-amino-acid deacylase